MRILYELEPSQKRLFADFWREEYELNARIASFPKPYVAIMDGVVMGGGVGISAHGNRRVVTERSRVAMPEVGIGFFPDVGASWLLSKAREIGAYLALSATSVAAADAIEAGLADVLIHAEDIEPLIGRLATIGAAEDVDVALRRLARHPGSGRLSLHRPLLAAATAHEQVARHYRRLRARRVGILLARGGGHQREVADGAESDARIAAARRGRA